MKAALQKALLTAHVMTSVGLVGAVGAFLALAIAGVTSRDPYTIQAVYPAMKLVPWLVILPLAFAALAIGIIQSLVTKWGLFRHYWVLAKLGLTIFAVIVLLVQTNTISQLAETSSATALLSGELRGMQFRLLVHAAGGLLVLLVATTLAIYKPAGLTPWVRQNRLAGK